LAILGFTNYLNGRISAQEHLDAFAGHNLIIHYQDANLTHRCAPFLSKSFWVLGEHAFARYQNGFIDTPSELIIYLNRVPNYITNPQIA